MSQSINKLIKQLSKHKIGIAGAGGLGSNCAVALVRAGVGNVVIADFDVVEDSNLNRQYFFRNQIGMYKVNALKDNLLSIRPETNIESHNIKLSSAEILEIFADCEIIIEAFDSAEMKKTIIETVLTQLPEIPLIVGSGMAGWGENNTLRTRKIASNLYICGDEKTEVSEKHPPVAPRVGIVANMLANTALDILLKNFECH